MKGRQIMMAGLAVSAAFAATKARAAARTETHECSIKYAKNSIIAAEAEFNRCLSAVESRKADVEYFQIVAGTGIAGKHQANLKRAEQRIDFLKKKLSADFPNARLDSINVGPNRQLGDSVRLSYVALTPEAKAAMAEASSPVTTEERRLHTTAGAGSESGEPQIEPPKEATDLPRVSAAPAVKAEVLRENFARIAVRMGQDADRDRNESFPAIGLEVAYVRPNTGMENLRTEIGGTAVSMSKGEDLSKQASAHVLLGAGYNLNGVIVGARALGGGVWDEDNKWRDDFGGEGRLGFENKSYSIFAGVGRTQKTARFGLDLGMML